MPVSSFEKLTHRLLEAHGTLIALALGVLYLRETLIVFTLRGMMALLIAAQVVVDVPLESLLLLGHGILDLSEALIVFTLSGLRALLIAA